MFVLLSLVMHPLSLGVCCCWLGMYFPWMKREQRFWVWQQTWALVGFFVVVALMSSTSRLGTEAP